MTRLQRRSPPKRPHLPARSGRKGICRLVEGKQVQGTWKLEVTDDTKKETGKLKSWSINVESAGVPAGNNFIDTNLTMLGNVGSDGVQNFTSRKIVVSDNGDAMAVWLESKGPGDTGPWNAMAARYVAGSWQTPVVIMNGNPSNVTKWSNWSAMASGITSR